MLEYSVWGDSEVFRGFIGANLRLPFSRPAEAIYLVLTPNTIASYSLDSWWVGADIELALSELERMFRTKYQLSSPFFAHIFLFIPSLDSGYFPFIRALFLGEPSATDILEDVMARGG